MKEFIHAIETADMESIEVWLSEDALHMINTPLPVSHRRAHYQNNSEKIYPLVLAWQLIISNLSSTEKFSTKYFTVFKKLIEMGADFQCLKTYQDDKDQQQWPPHKKPLLHQLCESYIENLERSEKNKFGHLLKSRFLPRKETDPQEKQQKRECIIWLIKTLLANKFNINKRDSQGHTVLPHLLCQGCLELVNLFLDNNADIWYVTPDGSTALHHFMQGIKYFDEPLDFLKRLLEYGIDVNTSNKSGETPFSQFLIYAPETLTTFFPILQQYGLQLNAILSRGQQEQTYAELVQYNNPDNFLLLIKQGMLVTAEIYLAIFRFHKDHQELQDYLFEQANIAQIISSHTGDSALHGTRSPTIIQRLLANGADIHYCNKKGETPFLTLIANSFYSEQGVELVKFFLENGANILDIDNAGNGVLHGAAKNIGLLIYLIKKGAPVNLCNEAGDSPLHLAIRNSVNIEVAMYLIERGAQIHCVNKQGEIPLDGMGSYFDNTAPLELIMLLLEALPKNYLPKNHQAILKTGCMLNNTGMLQKIFSQGFDHHSSFAGELLLNTAQWAMQRDDDKVLAWLLDRGVDVHYKKQDYGQNNTVWDNLVASYSFRSRQIKTQNDQNVIINRLFVLISTIKKHLQSTEFTESLQNLLSLLITSQQSVEHNWNLIHILIKKGIIISDTSTLESLISNAVRLNDDEILWFILNNQRSKAEFNQLLEIAAIAVIYHFRSDMLLPLITYGWDINKPLKFGYTDKQRPLSYLLGSSQSNYYHQTKTSEVDQLTCIRQLLDQPNLGINFTLNDLNLNYAFENQPYHILHMAIFKGWDEIVIRLLEPPFLISPNLMSKTLSPLVLAINYERFAIIELLLEKGADAKAVSNMGSPLQCAIRKNQENTVKLLLEHKANPNQQIGRENLYKIDPHSRLIHFSPQTDNKYPILFYAVDTANPNIVALLLKSGADTMLNSRVSAFFGDLDVLSYTLNSDKSHTVIPTLLPFVTVNYENVRQAIKCKTIRIELLSLLFSKLTEIEQLQLKPLLTVLASQNKRFDIVEWLIVQNEKFIYQKDFMGRHALYFIVQSELSDENQKTQALKLFKLLLSYNLNPYECDCEGQTVAAYAFYNGRLDTFDLQRPFSQIKEVEFVRLKKQLLLNYREFQNFNESLNKCAFKLIQLFETAECALQYLEKYYIKEQQNLRPIHNLCLFQLPMYGNWHTKEWNSLIIDKGFEFIKVLHLASQIETILGKEPDSLDEAFKAARQITYQRENENLELAALFKTNFIHELGFNRVLDDYVPKSADYIPNIEVDGATFGQPHYVLRKLAKNDKRGWILGVLTHCCQSIGNAGESYAMHGMTSPYSGFYAVFKRGKEKDIQRYTQLLSNAQRVKNIQEFIILIPKIDKSQRKRYLSWCEGKAKELHVNVLDFVVLENLRNYLEQLIVKEKEGELVAQLWAWCADDNKSFVFDSWERLRAEDDCLCEFFVKEAADKIMQHGFQRVLLGQFGNTPRNLPFEEAKNFAFPKDYFGVRDSHCQWLVKEGFVLNHTSTLQKALASTRFSVAKLKNDNICSLLISSSAFFKKAHEEYIIEHRHNHPKIQQAYDMRFGLVAR